MNVLAIIAEYNPMHNGHIYQIEQVKKLVNPDYCIAIISGYFTQRGDLSILSKWDKASIATACGVDLVIELPTVFACNNSEYFAKGAIEILNRLGVVTHLAFGSESGNIYNLLALADSMMIHFDQISAKIKDLSKNGISHFEARRNALEQLFGSDTANLMLNSNDILAIEYLKQLRLANSDIIPIAVKRKGSAFNFAEMSQDSFLSATAIRTFLSKADALTSLDSIAPFVPIQTLNAIKLISHEQLYKIDERYFTALGAILLNSHSDLAEIFSITEGLQNRIYRHFKESLTLQELKEKLYSKRYAKSRINRTLSQILLNITKKDIKEVIDQNLYYARILAFNASSSNLIKEIKKNKAVDLPLITNLSKEINSPALKYNTLLNFDIKAGNLYALLNGQSLHTGSDFVNSPRVI